MKTNYETGATSHAVNDLILFADNTRQLAELRDSIYKRAFNKDDIIHASFTVMGESHGRASLKMAFSQLLREAIKVYIREFPNSCDHVKNIKHWSDEGQEFCQLYADDFNNWKQDHGF